MNLLTNELPRTVTVEGKPYPIRTDFRTWLKFEEGMKRPGNVREKTVRIFDLCFPEETPHSAQQALTALSGFFLMRGYYGEDNSKTPPKRRHNLSQALDFTVDAGLIAAAFRQCYGIDLLTETSLHWHAFLLLLRALPEDCRLCQIMSYRTVELSDIGDPDLRRRYAELKEAYALPDNRSPEEKQQAVDDAIAGGFLF